MPRRDTVTQRHSGDMGVRWYCGHVDTLTQWHTLDDTWHAKDIRYKTNHTTRDTWHMTHDTWNIIQGTWHTTSFSVSSCSLGGIPSKAICFITTSLLSLFRSALYTRPYVPWPRGDRTLYLSIVAITPLYSSASSVSERGKDMTSSSCAHWMGNENMIQSNQMIKSGASYRLAGRSRPGSECTALKTRKIQ